MTVDVLCVGNAVVDALLTLQEQDPHYRLENGELRIRAGEKLLTKHSQFSIGGGACRVAIGLSRFGFKTTVCAEVGTDEFAQRILNTLKQEHVDLSNLKITEGQTSFTVGLNFLSDRTLFTSLVKRENTFPLDAITTTFVYLGSLGQAWEAAYAGAVSHAKKTKAQLVFNPGPTQFAAGVSAFNHILEDTSILFVNRQEAQEIAETKDTDPKTLLTLLKKMGPQTVVVTDGKEGSYAQDDSGESIKLGNYPTTVIEKTGAGDAYVSGFLAAILKKASLPDAMVWGTCSASSVISNASAHEGLITEEQIRRMMQSDKAPKPEHI